MKKLLFIATIVIFMIALTACGNKTNKDFNDFDNKLSDVKQKQKNVEEVIDKIERKILREYSGEISSNDLGNMIMTSLLDLDEVAYVRFASVYKKFESLDSFIKEIENIRNERRG